MSHNEPMKIPQRLINDVNALQAVHQQKLFDMVNGAVAALDLPLGTTFDFNTGEIILPADLQSPQIEEGQEDGNREIRQPE